MALPETLEKDPCHARQSDVPHPPVLSRLLANGESCAYQVIEQATGRGPRPTDRTGDLSDGQLPAVGDVVHRDQLRERELAPTELMKRGEEELSRERRRLTLLGHRRKCRPPT